MKATRTAGTYYREKSCIEDVLAIANEIAQGVRPGKAQNAGKNDAYPQRARKQTGIH
jgi:hypothetical protein